MLILLQSMEDMTKLLNNKIKTKMTKKNKKKNKNNKLKIFQAGKHIVKKPKLNPIGLLAKLNKQLPSSIIVIKTDGIK